MAYDYEPPQSDIFGFFIFTFVAGIVGLTITKDGKFRSTLEYQYLTTACLAFTVYIFPAIICLRVARGAALHGPPVPRNLLYAEAGICLANLVLTIVCGLLKFVPPLTKRLAPTDLHKLINRATYQKALERGNKIPEIWEGGYLRDHPSLWRFAMAYFFVRFLWIYWVHIPICIGINVYIAAKHHPPVMDFDAIVFWIFIGIVLVAVTIWFCLKICLFQAYIHFVLILNSIFTCYFIADTSYLANLLLGALAIYLSTTYDMINDRLVKKMYQLPSAWWFEMTAWRSGTPEAEEAPWGEEDKAQVQPPLQLVIGPPARKLPKYKAEECEENEEPTPPELKVKWPMGPQPLGGIRGEPQEDNDQNTVQRLEHSGVSEKEDNEGSSV
jgi:hypothetical protein